MLFSPEIPTAVATTAADDDGWITFLRRMDGSEDFYRGWADYKSGFGDPDREFWLGLDIIHTLTTSGPHSLRVDIIDGQSHLYYAEYTSFAIGDEGSKYVLHVGGYQPGSTAGDCLTNASSSSNINWRANGMKFSTLDSDNDRTGGQCAVTSGRGAFWYNSCQAANPMGTYGSTGNGGWMGVYWYTIDNSNTGLKGIKLKLKHV